MQDKADEVLGHAEGTRCYEIKYLDLVDANNGNAWISSKTGVDIYWGYPEGTDAGTDFTLLHFQDLHRDGAQSGFDVQDIEDCTVSVVTAENTGYGLKFHVDKGGFSPFALVWETAGRPVDPDRTPLPAPAAERITTVSPICALTLTVARHSIPSTEMGGTSISTPMRTVYTAHISPAGPAIVLQAGTKTPA